MSEKPNLIVITGPTATGKTALGVAVAKALNGEVVGAPIVEEVLFRGVVFQSLRKRNRVLAYVVSVVLFSLYHVWSYAIAAGDPKVLLYALQYVPLTLILTWTYERSGSLWTAIAFHSSYNFLAMYLTQQLQMIS